MDGGVFLGLDSGAEGRRGDLSSGNSAGWRLSASDPVGHHSGVQLQEEGLQLAQPAFLPLLLLLAASFFLVDAFVFALLFLAHPGHPGPPVAARVCPGVVRREVHGHGGLVVEGQPGQQELHHVGPLLRQVVALARVGRDVEEPDVPAGGVLARRQHVTLQVPPAAREGGEHLQRGGS